MKRTLSILGVVCFLTGCVAPDSSNQSSYQTRHVSADQLSIGMSRSQAKDIMGPPDDILKQMGENGVAEVWVYANTVTNVSKMEDLSRKLNYISGISKGYDVRDMQLRDQEIDNYQGRNQRKEILLGFVDGILKIVQMH